MNASSQDVELRSSPERFEAAALPELSRSTQALAAGLAP